jgi:predicted nucleic acid-binding protein
VPSFIVDASAVLAGFFRDESTESALRLLSRLSDEEAGAPAIFPFEMANGFAMGVRRGRATLEESQEALRRVAAFEIRIVDASRAEIHDRILPLAIAYGLTVYDAAYLHLAITLGIPLASYDDRLCKAAARESLLLVW